MWSLLTSEPALRRQHAEACLTTGEKARFPPYAAHLKLVRPEEADVVGHIEHEPAPIFHAPNEPIDILDLPRVDEVARSNLAQPS